MVKDENMIYEGQLLDESVTYTRTELMKICAIEQVVIVEMMEYGVIEPQGKSQAGEWLFSAKALRRSQRALRLQQDLAINWPGISLALDLLEEVEELRQMLQVLSNESPDQKL